MSDGGRKSFSEKDVDQNNGRSMQATEHNIIVHPEIHSSQVLCPINKHNTSVKSISPCTGLYCVCVHLKSCFSSRLQVRLNVPWVQICDAHQEARSSKSPEFAETEHLKERSTKKQFRNIMFSGVFQGVVVLKIAYFRVVWIVCSSSLEYLGHLGMVWASCGSCWGMLYLEEILDLPKTL